MTFIVTAMAMKKLTDETTNYTDDVDDDGEGKNDDDEDGAIPDDAD